MRQKEEFQEGRTSRTILAPFSEYSVSWKREERDVGTSSLQTKDEVEEGDRVEEVSPGQRVCGGRSPVVNGSKDWKVLNYPFLTGQGFVLGTQNQNQNG